MTLCRYGAARSFFEPQSQVLGLAWGFGFLCWVELEMLPEAEQCCSGCVGAICRRELACMEYLYNLCNLRLALAWQ